MELADNKTPCHKCQNMREVPWSCHIRCDNPDPDMTGDPHGIREGWFIYPTLFDPVWKTRVCNNYNAIDGEG